MYNQYGTQYDTMRMNIKEKLLKYFIVNFFKTFWTLFLLIGLATLGFYYIHIEYIPNLDLSSITFILIIISALTIFTIFSFIVIFTLPSLAWSIWAEDSELKHYWMDKEGRNHKKTARWFSLTIIYWVLISFITYYSIVVGVGIFIISISCAYLILKKNNQRRLTNKRLVFEIGMYCVFSLASFVSTSMLLWAISTIYNYTFIDVFNSQALLKLAVVCIVIIFINLIISSLSRSFNNLIIASILGFIGAFFLIVNFDIWERVPQSIVSRLKIGNINTSSIVLRSEGCEALKLSGWKTQPEDNNLCVIYNVKILSKLGTEMYLEKGNARLAIDTTQVVTWQLKSTTTTKGSEN